MWLWLVAPALILFWLTFYLMSGNFYNGAAYGYELARANHFFKQKQYKKAEAAYEEASKLKSTVFNNERAGTCALRLGQFAAAKALFRQAMRIDPKSARPWNGLGDLALAEKRPGEARSCYLKAIELDPANGDARSKLRKLGEKGKG